ncbi:hypothetical protein N1851_002314 [Merluccius polli]|uniref:Uncharacterized protein n=1 Tax=Merluccius polli TaxID=89951 RepID=A0AA47NC77_MERPO|nr:hypothetical protein N1851_002314 [Merluccius polli]
MEKEYAVMERNLKAALNEVDFVSTTADIWTANNRSYIGVTLHWISRSTLERNKAALACRRIRGKHTYDVIGAEIENIHSSYGLLNKVVATVTDNGSNFVKAFKVYQPQPVTESDDETEVGESTPTVDDVTFLDLSEILTAEDESDGQLSLPPHHRCASHTINLISTNDVDKYLTSNAESKAVYRSSTAKCTALWTKSSRSTLASETVEEVSKRKLLVPTSTRWNSFFDAVKRIAEIPMSELNTLCTKLGVKCFKDKEYQFLHEYCTAMKPLTAALDILQGDCPYGTLLPTLEVLMQKTLAVKDDLSRMTAGLPDAIVQTCFASVLDDKDALLAAVSCPKFKLRWLRDAGRRERVKELLTAECRRTIAPAAQSPASVPTTSASQGEMDFFTFEAEPEDTYSAENEVMDYLRSAYDLQILHQFSNIKNIFLKYNTPTPSSAPVEWLFSLGGLVLTPRRNRLSDKRFEKLLLMRSDHNLVHLKSCYVPLVRRTPVATRTVRRWTEEATGALQACFEVTDWKALCEPHGEDIDGLTECITDYVNFCVDTTVPPSTVLCYANNKPNEVSEEVRKVQQQLKLKIKEAKDAYRRKT